MAIVQNIKSADILLYSSIYTSTDIHRPMGGERKRRRRRRRRKKNERK